MNRKNIQKSKKNERVLPVIKAVQIEHTTNEWIDLMKGHTAWHRLLKYSQNQRFTTQLVSMEGSQYESIGLYLSNNATTLSL